MKFRPRTIRATVRRLSGVSRNLSLGARRTFGRVALFSQAQWAFGPVFCDSQQKRAPSGARFLFAD
jgi:hypothetical protein